MKGYKVFNSDWTCRGFQYEVGKTYEEDVKPECCERGFHFCTKISDCFNYYSFAYDNKVAEVEALGDIDHNNYDSKCSTNKIYIIRELTWEEVLDLTNIGKMCFGCGNINDYNIGNLNTGISNSGDRNSGNWNFGNLNAGDQNIGQENSGNYNIGNRNAGNHNIGDMNSGDWNCTFYSNGCFNTNLQKIFLFNKPSDWTYQDWLSSDARYILMNCPSNVLAWVWADGMTDEEKEQHPEYSVIGGFLKEIGAWSTRQKWWDHLLYRYKATVMALPNFDKDIFKTITGIDVDHKKEETDGNVSEN